MGREIRQLALQAVDHVVEETMRRKSRAGPQKPQAVPDYLGEPEDENYSPDREWMPALVLLAKNTHVWLAQLSRRYGRAIRTLADIPDEEMDLLSSQGMTGLWLIGLWERSRASERIKRLMGQPEAAASAYSVDDYDVASALGGWAALASLRERLLRRGIRLAADMVPNHMGIDSRWVIEHPDRFLALDQSPFSTYSFHSANVASDPRVEIRIEDHYYDQTDAAVVFERRDRASGAVKYIYHGNDGTSYPWNDTAQLDYSRADVREAVIQTILHIARSFPIIRFDSAMTLAREHIQRLWFPIPGSGGGIPTRADHGMTQAQFDALMPKEFWREVVDRISVEAPDTLLLAEAFWLLEGYFVRTLGMHRVYNSAFMNMLRDEHNAQYRTLLRNTLEFDPQILRRYVNFMSNPDEKTAIEQFGTGDKYFGICTLMVTLPGLPMFGHGQIEGLQERYGMEFRNPRLDEQPDPILIRRHDSTIVPLLKRRRLFDGVEDFCLFDFKLASGRVNENVLAYSNRRGSDRALVLVNNRNAAARGRLDRSAPALDKSSGRPSSRSLAEALDLPPDGYAVFRDYVTHLEYVRDCAQLRERGFSADLGPYQHHVFLDWRIQYGSDWGALCAALDGAGVESTDSMRATIAAQPVPAPQAVEASKAARRRRASRTIETPREAPRRRSSKRPGSKRPSRKPAATGKRSSRTSTKSTEPKDRSPKPAARKPGKHSPRPDR